MADPKEFLWVEKYRPSKVSDCILPDRLKQNFQAYVDQKQIPNLMLSGPAGVGKTTVAIAMCEEAGVNYMFLNSSKDRGIDVMKNEIAKYAATVSFNGKQKVVIADEADGMTSDAQDALRGCIEQFSTNCSFIFTCNIPAKIIPAIHSRCATIEFRLSKEEKLKMAVQFLRRLSQILDEQKVPYTKKALATLIDRYLPDYRKTIGVLQQLATTYSEIKDATVESGVDDTKFRELIEALKNKSFIAMRKWVVVNVGKLEDARFYRTLYDGLVMYLRPETIPSAILVLAKYQYQAAFCADPEINLVACLTELMSDTEFL